MMAQKIVLALVLVTFNFLSSARVNKTFNIMPMSAELKVNANRVGHYATIQGVSNWPDQSPHLCRSQQAYKALKQ